MVTKPAHLVDAAVTTSARMVTEQARRRPRSAGNVSPRPAHGDTSSAPSAEIRHHSQRGEARARSTGFLRHQWSAEPAPAGPSAAHAEKALAGRTRLPRLVLADSNIEAVKWLALVLMTVDHVNKYLFAQGLPWAFELGRLALPLFAFVLGYNLARPGARESGAFRRSMMRMGAFGLLATPAFIALNKLGWDWWPLNIMFTLLVATATMALIAQRRALSYIAAALFFLVGGAFVEFWWFGVALCLAAWWYCRAPSLAAAATWLAAAVALYVINGNLGAVAAFPVILAAPRLALKVPRARYTFYAYYPAHLTGLWVIWHFLQGAHA